MNEPTLFQMTDETELEELTLKYHRLQESRNKWRACAVELADTLYHRLPNLPDMDSFYELLHDKSEGVDDVLKPVFNSFDVT